MNYIDIIFAIPLAWFAFKGFTNGFITELAMLAALLLGIYLSIRFSAYIPDFFDIKDEHANLISFIICFLIVAVLVYLLGKWVENIASALSLGFFNHLLGATFGILKVAFVLSLCIYVMNQLDKTHALIKDDVRSKSLLYKPIEKIVPFVFQKMDTKNENIESGI